MQQCFPVGILGSPVDAKAYQYAKHLRIVGGIIVQGPVACGPEQFGAELGISRPMTRVHAGVTVQQYLPYRVGVLARSSGMHTQQIEVVCRRHIYHGSAPYQ